MSPTPLFIGRVDARGEQFAPADRARYRRWLKRLAGQEVDVTVRRHRSKRSLDQNAYWWWAMAFLAREAWGEADADGRERMHYWILCKHFGTFTTADGFTIPQRTSRGLTTKQFAEMIDWLVMFAARELNVIVPLPNEADLSAYDEDVA